MKISNRQPWSEVNQFISPKFRENVVDISLRHFPKASKELRSYAQQELTKAIQVPGFHRFASVPFKLAYKYSLMRFCDKNIVTAIIICLWAEANAELITELREKVERNGMALRPLLSWQEALNGFYTFDELGELQKYFDSLVVDKSEIEHDNFLLAELLIGPQYVEKDLEIVNVASDHAESNNKKGLSSLPVDKEQIDSLTSKQQSHQVLKTEEVSIETVASSEDEFEMADIEELSSTVTDIISSQQAVKQMSIAGLQKANEHISKLDYDYFQQAVSEFISMEQTWKNENSRLRIFVKNIKKHIDSEVASRPGIGIDLGFFDLPEGEDEIKIGLVQETIERIREYDVQKSILSVNLDRIRAEFAKVRDEIDGWMPGASNGRSIQLEQDPQEFSLQNIRALLAEAQQELDYMRGQANQLRQSSINRIKHLTSQLVEEELPMTTSFDHFGSFQDLITRPLSDWDNKELQKIEQSMAQMVEEMINNNTLGSAKLAGELLAKWSNEVFIKLLEKLAREKRDMEVYLLIMSANATRMDLKDLRLGRDMVSSLVNGLEQLSKKTNPYNLLCYSAPTLFSGWKTSDPILNVEMCILLLAAKYAGQYQLPGEILWENTEWPIKGMKTWSKVWESALMDQPLHILQPAQVDYSTSLKEARLNAEQMLSKEHGSYVHLVSIKSRRHVALIRTHFLPKIESQLDLFKEIEQSMRKATVHEQEKVLSKLITTLIPQFEEKFSENAVNELYEKAAAAEAINDDDAFHRRTSLKIIIESINSVLSYGRAIAEYFEDAMNKEDEIRFTDLQNEFSQIPDLGEFAKHALDALVKPNQDTQLVFDKLKVDYELKKTITTEILGLANYTPKFPRLIAHLVGNDFDWDKLISPILEDIEAPLGKEDAAAFLLANNAPNHVLMLTQYISLDIQKTAQKIKAMKEQEVQEIELELLKIGGSMNDLLADRDLGRWGYVIQNLNKRLAELKFEFDERISSKQKLASQVRNKINELDNDVFGAMNTIPVDAFPIVQNCLGIVRKATEKEVYIQSIEEFLKDIRFRLVHNSWPVNDLTDLEHHLQSLFEGEETSSSNLISITELIDIFESGALNKIGLSSTDIALSSLGTRIDLLSNWLQVKDGTEFLFERQLSPTRTAIQNLFRYFAQTMAMKRTLNPEGKPVSMEYPVIFSYWDLQYPKTSVLENHCIFVALPGDPPSTADIADFQDVLEQNEWLDLFFVFLFLPGGNPKLCNRLQSLFRNKPLVVIDDKALMDMMLAEKQGKSPLGILRPLMLNSLKTQNIDVFKVTQLVDANSSIFLGRDSQIKQIVSSSSNYAIYGGRRIGKSSVMNAVEKQLVKKGGQVISHDFQGEENVSDSATAIKLARKLGIENSLSKLGDFKSALEDHLEHNPDIHVTIMLDEIDKYIIENPNRHTIIETCRAISDRFSGQFRVIIAGFMRLYDCLQGKGPYTPTSDPWQRMFNGVLISNLSSSSAEEIVKEGFLQILGWEFENRAIPQRIVELTGGHPAFVQSLCQKIQERIGLRGDRLVKLDDIQAVFSDAHPDESFIAFVRNTLKMNLDPIGRYLIVWLVSKSQNALGFTWAQIVEYASVSEVPIPESKLDRSVNRLVVTNVIRKVAPQYYEFSVPDYPKILYQLNETSNLKSLFEEMAVYLQSDSDTHD